MARPKLNYRCDECGAAALQWVGRCSSCGSWNSIVEEADPESAARDLGPAPDPVPIGDIDPLGAPPRPTRIDEFDRVLGGGLVPGSVTLVGGEPGIGKSTLLLQSLARMAGDGATALLVSGEESTAQVRARAQRLGALQPSLLILSETSLPRILAAVEARSPSVCVIDSIQAVADPDVSGSPGSLAQVRGCAARLTDMAKRREMACVLVGHVTKDGAIAGPRALEHLVDTVLSFEGERHHSLRLLRALKHRFGPTGELGLFEMADAGLMGVRDPSGLLLGDRRAGVAGSVVVPALEGRRPLLVEVQALVAPSALALPRRSAQGLDAGRLSLLIAVLAQRVGLSLASWDVYVAAVGGVKIVEPAADLAVALAIASARANRPLPAGLVACGEIGLSGELRQVHQMARRLGEAVRLGFRQAAVPVSAPDGPAGLRLVRAATLPEIVALLVPGATDRLVALSGQSGKG